MDTLRDYAASLLLLLLFYSSPLLLLLLGWGLYRVLFGWLKRRFQRIHPSLQLLIFSHILYLAAFLDIIALCLVQRDGPDILIFIALAVGGFGFYLAVAE